MDSAMTLRPCFLALVSVLAACRSQEPVDVAPPADVAPGAWRSEIIDLPPEFAPELPSGSELLFFAPGMFEEGAEDYWSYVFMLVINEPAPDAERLAEILELYYDGLIASVAEGAKLDVGDDPATVQVTDEGKGRFTATIELIDAFVTHKPIRVTARIQTSAAGGDRSRVQVEASPQPAGHPVWTQLEGITLASRTTTVWLGWI